VWFYDFLDAHDKLLKLQLGFQSVFSFLEMRGVMKKVSRADREFYEVSRRHIRSHEPSEKELRIMHIYQDDVVRICTKPVDDFIWVVKRGEILDRAIKIVNISYKKGTYKLLQPYSHYAYYFVHSYDLITKYHSEIETSVGFEKTLNAVVAFDSVTNMLHHSLAACLQVAQGFPITGNVWGDAHMINFIVKFDLMGGDILGAKTHLNEYINGDITPRLYMPQLPEESLGDPIISELFKNVVVGKPFLTSTAKDCICQKDAKNPKS